LRHQHYVDIFVINKTPSILDTLMGKTLPPFSQLLEYERRRWAPFRRALRKEDQVILDRLFDCAKGICRKFSLAGHLGYGHLGYDLPL